MKANTITENEIADLKVSALPTRPTTPTAFGGKGYTATEMKAAFDRLPLYIMERLNTLIDDIRGVDGETVLNAIPTGIKESHTLSDLIEDIKSGSFSAYLTVTDGTLSEYLLELREDINKIAAAVGVTL
jgi:hypothetical protein